MDETISDVANGWTNPGKCRHLAYYDQAEGAVPNPGMGVCCYVYSDHMVFTDSDWKTYSAPRPLDRATFDRMVALEHCDTLYLRSEWRDIQCEPGRLNLPDYWQWTIEACQRLGKRWSFRIQHAMPQSVFAHSVPDFLIPRLNFIPYRNGDAWGPDTKYFPAYDDLYLGYWSEMLHLLGARFDGDPHLEFGDISGYGKWGEWHHYPEQGIEGEAHGPIMRRLIDDHLSAFPGTPSLMLLIPANPEAHFPGTRAKIEAMTYALGRGCGLRRDSFYPQFTPHELQVLTQVRQPGTMLVYEAGFYSTHDHAPLAGDPPHYVGYEQMFQPLLDIGSSYVGLGFNPWHAIDTHERFPDLLRRITRRVGYRIRPAVIWVLKGGNATLTLGLMNDGVAAPSGTLTVTAEFDNSPPLTLELPPGEPHPGLMKLCNLVLPGDFARFGNSTVTLRMNIRMAQKKYPVRWAVREGTADPGGYTLRMNLPKGLG
jgi:hypothetical protein